MKSHVFKVVVESDENARHARAKTLRRTAKRNCPFGRPSENESRILHEGTLTIRTLKRTVIGLIALGLVVGSAIALTAQAGPKKTKLSEMAEGLQPETPKTEMQRVHAKLWNQGLWSHPQQAAGLHPSAVVKLRDLTPGLPIKNFIQCELKVLSWGPGTPRPGGFSCSSEAIVIGTVRSQSPHLTDDETLIFTDYEFQVEQVLKDTRQKIARGEGLILTRPGGSLLLDGRSAIVVNFEIPPLHVRAAYLLFLNLVEETGAWRPARTYSLFNTWGTFRPGPEDQILTPENPSPIDISLTNIREDINRDCSKGGRRTGAEL